MAQKLLFVLFHTVFVLGTVGSLEGYRHWLLHVGYDRPEIAYRPAYVIAAVLVLALVAGLASVFYSLGLFLSLTLTSLIGLSFLAHLLLQFATGRLSDPKEMRRMMADDL